MLCDVQLDQMHVKYKKNSIVEKNAIAQRENPT